MADIRFGVGDIARTAHCWLAVTSANGIAGRVIPTQSDKEAIMIANTLRATRCEVTQHPTMKAAADAVRQRTGKNAA